MADARRFPLFAAHALLIGCAGAARPTTAGPPTTAPLPAPATEAEAPVGAEQSGAPAQARPASGKPCGPLECLAFDTPEAAFGHVLGTRPRVLAVGEAHAQRGELPVHSATRRFGEKLLPQLAGRASDIVIELMIASGRCGKEREQAVAKRQEPVMEAQAAPNQNEFVTLGTAAKRLGIAPHALEPSCQEYQAVLDAGSADIAQLLELIAKATARAVTQLLEKPAAEGTLVVTYGGLRHNDLEPKPGMEAWSFGPGLSALTAGRYVELDLIVPEFIKDTEAWRGMPWYAHYDPSELGSHAVLFRPSPSSYVLVFPRTSPARPAAQNPAQSPR